MKIICHPDISQKGRDIKNVRNKFMTGRYLWAYFGNDYKVFKSIEALCGHEKRLKLGDAFHVIAKELKPQYLDYVSRLSKSNQSSILWWASGMASKSPFMTQFFKLFCYWELVSKLLNDHSNLIIFVEDPFLFQMMKKTFSRREVDFAGKIHFCFIRLIFKAVFYRLRLTGYLLILKFKIRRIPDIDLASISILLFSWINPGSFRENGLFIDHYLGELKSYLDKQRKRAARLTFSSFPKRQITEIKKAKEPFVMPIKYISLWQIIKSGLTIFSFKYNGFQQFNGVDITPFLQREIFQENVQAEFIKHMVFCAGLRKIFTKANNLDVVFHPFEGQPWEKMLALAAKTVNPKIKIFGYQHSSFSPFDLNYFLGLNEVEFNPLPDMLLSNSEYNRARLVKGGFSEDKVRNIGSLRYPYVFEPKPCPRLTQATKASLLVCLPYSCEIAFEMLSDIMPALLKFKEMSLLAKIRIKPHPLVPFDFSTLENSEKFMRAIELVSGKLESELAESDILLYCNGTVSIEGLYADKKLIKYLPELELDLDPLALAEDNYCIKVCTRGEFEKNFLEIISNGHKAIGRGKNMFDLVDYRKIGQLLEL